MRWYTDVVVAPADGIRQEASPSLIAPSDHAAQIQCRPPPPKSADPLQSDEPAGLRGRTAPARLSYPGHCREGPDGLSANFRLQCEGWVGEDDEPIQAHHWRHFARPQPAGPGGRNPFASTFSTGCST